MIDVKLLRENPAAVRAAVARKKFACDLDAVLDLDRRRRALVTETEQLRARQKAANAEMAKLNKSAPEFQEKVKELKALAGALKELQARGQEAEDEWKTALLSIPNPPHDSVPDGKDENDNAAHSSWGDPAGASPSAKPHDEIPVFQEQVDFPRGTKVTGAGFPFFKGEMACLARALISFFLDEARNNGYIELAPPLAVNAASATATGQLPDKEGQMYAVPIDNLFLIPTAEVPVTNYYRDEILPPEQLPVLHCAYTPCFRREAGSYGKHVRGLNRVHQFDKVELVKWVHPDSSYEELEKLREDAERLLRKLGLPYRTMLMCAGEIGFPHAKQYDLEVWAAGQKRWLEVSSCSNFTDFQARRANIRFRGPDGRSRFVHTLNGSALALPRVIVALLENNLQADGSVLLPEVLQKLLGQEKLGA